MMMTFSEKLIGEAYVCSFGNFVENSLVSIALSTLAALWGPAMLQVFPVSN